MFSFVCCTALPRSPLSAYHLAIASSASPARRVNIKEELGYVQCGCRRVQRRYAYLWRLHRTRDAVSAIQGTPEARALLLAAAKRMQTWKYPLLGSCPVPIIPTQRPQRFAGQSQSCESKYPRPWQELCLGQRRMSAGNQRIGAGNESAAQPADAACALLWPSPRPQAASRRRAPRSCCSPLLKACLVPCSEGTRVPLVPTQGAHHWRHQEQDWCQRLSAEQEDVRVWSFSLLLLPLGPSTLRSGK